MELETEKTIQNNGLCTTPGVTSPTKTPVTTIAQRDYMVVYDNFDKNFNLTMGAVSPDEITTTLSKMTGFYTSYNIKLGIATIAYNKRFAELCSGTDENNKPISAAKAEILAEATDEYAEYIMNKAHVSNIDTDIKTLLALIGPKKKEYGYSGN